MLLPRLLEFPFFRAWLVVARSNFFFGGNSAKIDQGDINLFLWPSPKFNLDAMRLQVRPF